MGSQQPAPLVGVDRGAQVFLGRGRVTGPQLGGAGDAQDEQGYHVPTGQPETRERARVVGDPAGGRGERDEIATGAGVARLDQIQDDPEALGARLRKVIRAGRGSGHQLPHLAVRAQVDAGSGEGARKLGLAEQRIPRCGGQEMSSSRALTRITRAGRGCRGPAASGHRPPRRAYRMASRGRSAACHSAARRWNRAACAGR